MTRIAFVGDGDTPDTEFTETWAIWTMNADGSDRQQIAVGGLAPAWSPDGSRIAFHRWGANEPQLWVVNADGSGETLLGPGSRPAWSPDGSRITYVAAGDRRARRRQRRAAGSPIRPGRQVVHGAAADLVPTPGSHPA